MTSKDEFKSIQGFWKKLSGEDINKHRTTNGVTYSALFTMNSKDKLKNKRDNKYLLDERAEKDEEDQRISDAIHSVAEYVSAPKHRVHLECEPVVDILSVSLLCNNNARKEPWEVCGVIFVHDDRANVNFIYERDEVGELHLDHEPDVIPVDGGTLSLTGPKIDVSMYLPYICVDLWDNVTGEAIVQGYAQLSKTVDIAEEEEEENHPFEQFRTITIAGNGNGCSAVIDYLALTFGIFAQVEVQLCGSGSGSKNEEEEEILVYGKISVDYNLYHSEKRGNSIALFELKEDSKYFAPTDLGSPIPLPRSVVAVPAYSFLNVHVDLWSHAKTAPIVQGSFTLDTDNHDVKRLIYGLSGTNAQVTVKWHKPDILGSKPAIRRRIRNPVFPNSMSHLALRTVEVFSLFIGRQIDKDLSLYGIINTFGMGEFNIFERDKDDPYILPRGCSFLPLEIVEDVLVPADYFYVSMDLKDIEGLVSIKETIVIDLRNRVMVKWYDRLLCSVVKGVDNHSFAALHYTIFSDALKATLKIQFYSECEQFTDTCIRIHGSLVFRYGEYGIRRQYEKLYHRCVFFKRHKQNPLEKSGNVFDMELSRSVFAVPSDSSVVIVADLSCCSSTGFTAYLRQTKEFQIGTENVTIEGDEFSLNIAVKWGRS